MGANYQLEISTLLKATVRSVLPLETLPLFKMTCPIFFLGSLQPHFGPDQHLAFKGINVDEKEKQNYLDLTIAYRQTVLNCIRYLKKIG